MNASSTGATATLPTWMRRALYATAVMNIVAAVGFTPPAHALRVLAGLPEPDHPLYLVTTGLFVLLFGLGYLWTAVTGRADRLFITLAAAGKLAFFTTVAWLWATGALVARAPLAASADLVFGLLFVAWLLRDD
jgi:hypothetical protein